MRDDTIAAEILRAVAKLRQYSESAIDAALDGSVPNADIMAVHDDVNELVNLTVESSVTEAVEVVKGDIKGYSENIRDSIEVLSGEITRCREQIHDINTSIDEKIAFVASKITAAVVANVTTIATTQITEQLELTIADSVSKLELEINALKNAKPSTISLDEFGLDLGCSQMPDFLGDLRGKVEPRESGVTMGGVFSEDNARTGHMRDPSLSLDASKSDCMDVLKNNPLFQKVSGSKNVVYKPGCGLQIVNDEELAQHNAEFNYDNDHFDDLDDSDDHNPAWDEALRKRGL